MFRRGGLYYITVSDPACPYCRTGTSYMTAPAPLGPWSGPRKISESSCGGQPTHVAPLPAADGGTVYLYQSDLWNDHERNQATAAHFWTPLEFTAAGEISEITCEPYAYVPLQVSRSSGREALTSSRFRLDCDLGPPTPYGALHRETRFRAQRSGRLRKLLFPVFRRGTPGAPLVVEVRQGDEVLERDSVHASSLTWSSRRHLLATDVPVTAGEEYVVRFSASSTTGCYGLAYYSDPAPRPSPQQWVTIDSGRSWARDEDRTLKLDLQIAD